MKLIASVKRVSHSVDIKITAIRIVVFLKRGSNNSVWHNCFSILPFFYQVFGFVSNSTKFNRSGIQTIILMSVFFPRKLCVLILIMMLIITHGTKHNLSYGKRLLFRIRISSYTYL